MIIAPHIHGRWKMLQRHKDIAEINRQSTVERMKISHALNHGWADEKTFEAVNEFYESRRKYQEEITTKNSPY